MAKVTIVIQDRDNGTTDVSVAYDPPIRSNEAVTPAQTVALRALAATNDRSNPPETCFPPKLTRRSNVWAAGQHGVIVNIENPGSLDGCELYTVQWDDGSQSKYYSRHLFALGRFNTLAEFTAAVKLQGPIQLTVGPRGDWRSAALRVNFDGVDMQTTVYDRDFWRFFLQPLAVSMGVQVI